MIMSVAYYTKNFSNKDTKKAYKKATDWLAKYVMRKEDESIVSSTYSIEQLKNTALPTFKVTLYCALQSDDEEKRYCEACKSIHKSFFINEEYNCSTCKHKAFLKRMENRLSVKKHYKKDRLNYYLDNK